VISTSNEPTLWEVHTPGHKGPKIIEVCKRRPKSINHGMTFALPALRARGL
jgi:hypothetical protein